MCSDNLYNIGVNKYIYLPTVCEFVDAFTFAVIANTWDKQYSSQTLGWAKGPSDTYMSMNTRGDYSSVFLRKTSDFTPLL